MFSAKSRGHALERFCFELCSSELPLGRDQCLVEHLKAKGARVALCVNSDLERAITLIEKHPFDCVKLNTRWLDSCAN